VKRPSSLVLCVFFLSRASGAVEPASHPFVVEVTATGHSDALDALESRTRALLRDDPVVVEWIVSDAIRPRDVFESSRDPALAHIWLDASDAARAVLYVVDPAHERFLVRVVPLENGYDEIAWESVGTIIESSVEALLAGATVGVSREKAEEQLAALESKPMGPKSAPSPPPPEPISQEPVARPGPGYRFGLDVSYRLQAWSADPVFLHGPELGLHWLSRAPRVTGAALLTVGYHLPVDWEKEGVGGNFQGPFVRAGPGLRFQTGSRTNLSLFAVAGFDWLLVTPKASAGAASPRERMDVFAATLGFMVEGEWILSRAVSTWLALGAEGDLLGNHFDLIVAGEPETVLQPWPLQPFARLGLRFSP
jgi:hypothetical protein